MFFDYPSNRDGKINFISFQSYFSTEKAIGGTCSISVYQTSVCPKAVVVDEAFTMQQNKMENEANRPEKAIVGELLSPTAVLSV